MSSNRNHTNHHHRPSDGRRKALAEDVTVPDVSNFFPIERYYDAADKLYASVVALASKAAKASDSSVETLDACYVYGKRYCEFVLTAIPQHSYYGTVRYRPLRVKHTQQLQAVVSILEETADKMDAQEVRLAEAARLRQLQLEQQRARQEQARLEAWQQQMQQQKQISSIQQQQQSNVEQSAMDKLKLLGQTQVSTGVLVVPTDQKPSTTRYRFIDSDEDEDDATQIIADDVLLPPPLLPPSDDDTFLPAPPPPSYDAAITTARHHQHKHLPFYASSAAANSNDDAFTVRPPLERPEQPLPKQFVPMRQQQELHRTTYTQFTKAGKITVRPIRTYQGRIGSSTNGCTVISALTVARHLKNSNHDVIADSVIVDIIDRQCGPLLAQIRRKLGLGDHALIIPSDVHDHLVDAGVLRQDHFCGAAGGNILEDAHIGEFIQLLASSASSDSNNGKNNAKTTKAGATLFFREHVISIVRYLGEDGGGAPRYDLIDSMPTHSSGCATRTICSDVQSLRVLLLYYASRKFSDANCRTIDRNPWDDAMADLDPRVFQGFVWSC